MGDRQLFTEIYPELQIMVEINEIRFEGGMNWNKFEQAIKDIIKFNKISFAGDIPPQILNLFKANSKEHLKKYFLRKYQEIRDDRARMMADTGFMGARNQGAAQARVGIMNQARRNQDLRAAAAIERRRLDRLARQPTVQLPTTQIPGYNLFRPMATIIPPGLSRGRTLQKKRTKRTKGKSPKRRTRSKHRQASKAKKTRSRAPSRHRR